MSETVDWSVTTPEGFALHCGSAGEGPVLLVLHGGPGGAGCGYLSGLTALAGPDRRVVLFDQLGTGRSDVPPPGYDWTLAGAVDDVEAVRAATGAGRVDLIGHSWGGMLALEYALRRPDRVRRLVLSNTIASAARMTLGFIAQLTELLTPEQLVQALTADALGEHHDPRFRDAVARWLAGWLAAGDGLLPAGLLDEALDSGPAGRGLWGDRLWFATGALRGWDVEPRLGEISAPTLLVNGGHDSSGSDANAPIAAGIPDCEWVTLARSGHDPLDGPAAGTYLALLAAFLDHPDPDAEGATR